MANNQQDATQAVPRVGDPQLGMGHDGRMLTINIIVHADSSA
jgi:hypothetical protein